MDPLENPAFVIFSAIAPLLIAFIKQSGFSTQVNALIAFAAYIIVGVAGAFLSGEAFTAENAVAFITVVTVVGSAAYNLVWNNLLVGAEGTKSLDERLTAATSIIKPSTDGVPTPASP